MEVYSRGWTLLRSMPEYSMFAMVRMQTLLVILVVLNLIGLTIAAFVIMRKK